MAGTCTIREKVGYMQVLSFFKNHDKVYKIGYPSEL